MSILDGLREAFTGIGNTPPLPDPNTTRPPVDQAPQGQSGRAHYYGFIQWDETNPAWIGTSGLKLADQMWRTDGDVKRDTLACWSPIMTASYTLEPFGGDEATDQDRFAADLATYGLFNFMKPNLYGHLNEVGPILIRSGFVDFEQIWKSTKFKGKSVILPKKLDLRLPRTIWKWYQDDDGDLTGVVQFLPNSKNVFIPASELVHYRLQAEGDNWVGTSMYRHAYRHWYMKEKLEMISAIGEERKAVGVPVVYPPTGATQRQKEDVEQILANLHTNEVGFVIMPGPKAAAHVEPSIGWEIDVIKFDSSSGDSIRAVIDQQTLKVAGAFLADFLELGHHQVGARATAEVQMDPFMTAVKALGDLVVQPMQELVTRIAMMNVPGIEGPPKLKLALHDEASLSELSTYGLQLYQAGLLTPDSPTEAWFRARAGMPAQDPDVREESEEAQKMARQRAIEGEPEGGGDGPGEGSTSGGGTKSGGGAKGGLKKTERTKGGTGSGLEDPDLSQGNVKRATERDPHKTNTGPKKPSQKTLMLDTAGEAPDGVMVALYPPPGVAEQLAVKDGLDPKDLHITLAYLGEALNLADPGALRNTVARWAADTPPLAATISGMGIFSPASTSEGQPVTYASVDAPQLSRHRERLVQNLKRAGVPASEAHGFVPHVTLAYSEHRDVEPPAQSVAFDHVTLTIAGERQHFPLAGRTVETRQLDAAHGSPVTAPWYEELLSQGRLREALDGARTEMEKVTKPAAIKLAATMAARGRLGRRIAVGNPPSDLMQAFREEIERLYAVGYDTVKDELDVQHKATSTQPVQLDAGEAEESDEPEVAAAVAHRRGRITKRARIASEYVNNEVAREVERMVTAGESEPLALQRRAEVVALAAIRKEALTNASSSINDGRRDAALVVAAVLAARLGKTGDSLAEPEGAPEGDVGTGGVSAVAGEPGSELRGIYTAVLDSRTCDYCELADDGIERDVEDPALTVPNPECSGREFCRCTVVYVLAGAQEALEP